MSSPHGVILKRILVATDYSPAAHRAVWRAGHLARMHDAHLHLVHAQPDWNLYSQTTPGTAEQFNAVTRHAENSLRTEVAWIETTFEVHARGENRMGRASEVLRAMVHEVEPHLIVAGARGEHDVPRAAPLLGGTALKLIAFAPRPTLIVRGVEQPYRSVLAAVEAPSEIAQRLIRWAHTLVESGDCHIVHAFDVPYVARLRAHGLPEMSLLECQANVRNSSSGVVEELVAATGETHLRLHAHLVCGEAVSAVLDEIALRRPDVVILGKHQHPTRDVGLTPLGSVALRVAYHAPGDVLIVP
ncbi:MAG TPA: universal stress protein [Steroidobacteraceae bacterium]|nr:universal stress protein [Steroidobacteraceae bacterium]